MPDKDKAVVNADCKKEEAQPKPRRLLEIARL